MYSDSIRKKLGSVVTKWSQDVTMSARRFSALERYGFANLMSLSYSFCLRQFCLSLLCLSWRVQRFVLIAGARAAKAIRRVQILLGFSTDKPYFAVEVSLNLISYVL